MEATSASGALVSLNGSGSSDANGDTLTFEWRDAASQVVGNAAIVNLTLALGVHTFTLTVDDGNGGTDSDVVQVTVQDTFAPSISIASPTGTSYALNQAVAASYTCTDVVSGVASCEGSVPSGANIDTGSAGSQDFTVTATDNVGNTGSMTVPYTVTAGVPVLTWANPASITYGTALGGTQLNATASVAGTFTYTPAAGTVLNAGAGQPLHVDFVPTDAVNYTTASADVTITVNQAPTNTTVSNASAVFNTSSQTVALSATVTGSVVSDGQVSFTVRNGPATIGAPVTVSVNASGVATANFTLPGGTPAGTYTIEAAFTGSANFAGSQGTATLSVLQAYDLTGLFEPYGPPGLKQFKAGSSIPLKWQYTLDGAVIESAAYQATLTAYGPVNCGEATGGVTLAVDAPGNSGFQYSAATRTWQFNWKTAKGTNGCFYLVIDQPTLGVTRTFPIKIVE